MSKKRVRYVWIPIIISLLAVPIGFYYVNWSKGGEGAGLYSHAWIPDKVFAYWNPEKFYDPVDSVVGVFEGEQCVTCHEAVTPGIVNDWRASGHSKPANNKQPVYCSDCHGSDHKKLHLPSPEVCGSCHNTQHTQFKDERRYGFPSHALAMERALDAKHFADKPKAEVTACLQCHSVATKCDSCHTRHRFSAAEARRPEACLTCHSGPPHPDDETYFASAHGKRYLAEGNTWDWSKPLRKGNYPVPTCAYCHMDNGKHQVADKSIWKFGIKEVNPLTSGNKVKRDKWVAMCSDCHEADWSRQRLTEMDAERKGAWKKLYAAEDILRDLRRKDRLYPAAGERPPYPNDLVDSIWPRERIGFFDGQASAFYNVSSIERDYFEMWYFHNLGAYKGAAHGDIETIKKGHDGMDKSLATILKKAGAINKLTEKELELNGRRSDPGKLWFSGEYTEFNQENN